MDPMEDRPSGFEGKIETLDHSKSMTVFFLKHSNRTYKNFRITYKGEVY